MSSYPHSLHLTPDKARFGVRYVWEIPVRISHWALVLSIPFLFATGMFISWPIASGSGEAWNHFVMGRVREIHFIAAYLFMAALLLRICWFFIGNNFARSGFPMFWRLDWWKSVWEQMVWYLGTKRGRVDLGHNSLAGLSYVVFIFGGGIFMMLTGFALYGEDNPGGFWDRLCGWAVPLFGGSYSVHWWHHTVAWSFVLFVIFHVYIIVFDAVRYSNGLAGSMFSGEKFYREGDIDSDEWLS